MTLLEVKDLDVFFKTETGPLQVLDGVSFNVEKGQIHGIVGESGSGKSVTGLSLLKLLPLPAGEIKKGQAFFNGEDLLSLSPQQMYSVRGRKVSIIFQEPMTALNPTKKIGKQVTECLDLHYPQMSKSEKRLKALDLFKEVKIPDGERRLSEYPHQLSGGLRQRVCIAMALICDPELIIADEPTTALDVTIQAQILGLIKELQASRGLSVIFITHDLGVVARLCDHVSVMYAGEIIESGDVKDIMFHPHHPYTKALLDSIPSLKTKPKEALTVIEGNPIGPGLWPQGCRFFDRCTKSDDKKCRDERPRLKTNGNGHLVSCFYPEGDHS